MGASSPRAHRQGQGRPNVVPISGGSPAAGGPIPPRFERQLRGAARRRRGDESSWVAVARVDGVDHIRREYGDPAAEEFLRGTASVLRSTLRESDKLAPVARAEYGILLDAPSGDDAVAGLQRLVEKVRELAGRDHRWSTGSLSVGVTPLWTDEPAAIIARARTALERSGSDGAARVVMATALR